MKHSLQQACFLLFLALLATPLGAQNTPVNVDVNLLQPSVYPNDLAEPGAAIVTITLLDNRPNYVGILNLTLSNNSGQSVTTPLTAELEVNLTRGVPLVLTGSRLAPFVRLLGADAGAGLTDNGIVLAEGEQQLCALVFDPLFLGQPISNQDLNCSFGFAELHEPPTPISPVDEEVAISPLQDAVNFTWLPNYFAGPVINYLTIWDVPREWTGVTPDLIISSLEPVRQPLRVPELNAISKLWTTAEADLIPGHRYLYQLQATDPTGRVRFRNNGYARPVFFEYTYPIPSTDQLCYEPDELALTGSNGNYQLNWTGYALDSVNHTVSVVTLPERRFVLQSELLTTPTFPTRQLVNGGPQASFSYDIDVDLDTTNRQAYLITLCTVCSLTGEEFCREVVLGTPGEPGPEGECPTEDDILAGVTVSALLPDRILADLSGAFPGTDPNGWSASINDGSNETTPGQINAPPTFPAPASAPTDTTFSALNPNSSYVITVCYACPGGSTTCANWTLDLNGNDDCLTSLNFTRPDSTDTTLDLAWTYNPGTVPASDSFQLIWQVSDRSYPETMATVAYADGTFTIQDRIPGQAYTLRVCAECTAGQLVCRDLAPFGGCVAEYLPELMDLRGRRALLSWHGDDRNLETQVRYGMRNLGGWENAQPVSSQNFTAANYDRPEDQLVQTAPLYATTYVGQVRTACADSLWSEWSEPILFSRSCALALTDSLHVWEITDSNALVTGQVMPQAQNYVFSYRQTGTQAWILSTDRPTPDLLLAGLIADTEYDVKLRYRCGGGVWSNYSEVFTFRTLTPCAAPENISFADVTASSAVISWTSGNYAETTSFRYRIAGGSGAWQTVTFAGNSGMLTDLAPGEAYEIEAVSHCAANNSYASAPQSLVLSCAPPELRVTDVTVSSAQLQAFGRSPAAVSNGFAYRVVGAADWILVDSAYLSGLDDLTEYEARARTTCTSGEASDWSDPVRFETPVDCRVPNELGVTSLSTVSAGLRWATTGSNERWEIRLLEEGAAGRLQTMEQAATIGIQDFGVSFEEEGGGGVYNNPTPPDPYADWRLITSDSPEVLVEGLKAYTDYRIVVRTYCPTNGWTDYSEDLLLRTLCATQPADSLYADQILEDRARLRFQPDTRCQIENEIVLEHPETMYADASTQSVWYHTFTNLQPNTVYRFKVRTKAESYAFTPAANGYTTMADVGADAGARVVGEAGWTAFSAWQTFRTDDCAPPYDFVENTLDQSTIEITWAASNGINTYEFKYKLADVLGADWAYLNVSEPYVRLENILRGTLYDYQVTELCQNGQTFQPAPQDTFLLKRESRNNGFYACGVESDVDLSNEVPLGTLAVGDTITAFDFPVVITSVSGGGGNFSGEGEIRVPYFNKAKATFAFDGIFVNDDYQMKGGKLVAIGAGVEVLPPWADELLAEVMGALQMLDAYLEEEQLELLDSLMSCCSATLPAELRQRIFDLQNCYAAQAEQDTPNYSLCADMLEALMADIQAFLDAIYGGTFQVTFSAAPDQTYGFDGYNDGDGGRRQNWYETDTLAKEPYPIAFKSIKAGDSDRVLAEIPFSGGPTNVYQDSIGYELPTGTIPGYSYPDAVATTATLTVPTASGMDENFFLAATQIDPSTDSVPPFIAGLLDVIPYEELTPTLRIIETTPGALDGLDSAAVQQRIRDIYAQAIVKPSVEYVRFAEAVDYIPQDYEAPLQAVPSGWLTPYTQQMKSFRRNYLDQETPADDEYIFFVFGEGSFEDTDRLGFMPPGRRFSFIYRNGEKNTNVADFGRTIAHELGHGAYVLRHPWTYPENDDRYVAQSNDTRNLMDGNGATELWKWQWDLIHDPEGAPLLPGDEDGEYADANWQFAEKFHNLYYASLSFDDSVLGFVSNTGERVNLKSNKVRELRFATGGEQYGNGKYIPIGTLTAFSIIDINGKKRAYYNCPDGKYREIDTLNTSLVYTSDWNTNPTCSGSIYDDLGQVSPKHYLVKPSYTYDQITGNVIPGTHVAEYDLPADANPNSEYTYDSYVSCFYSNLGLPTSTPGIPPAGIALIEDKGQFYPNNDTRTPDLVLDGTFSEEVYKNLLRDFPSYSDHNLLSSFYFTGVAFSVYAHGKIVPICDSQEEMNLVVPLFSELNRPLLTIGDYEIPSIDELLEVELDPSIPGFVRDALQMIRSIRNIEVAKILDVLKAFKKRQDLFLAIKERVTDLDHSNYKDGVRAILVAYAQLIDCEFESLNLTGKDAGYLVAGIGERSYSSSEAIEEKAILKIVKSLPNSSYLEFVSFLDTAILDSGLPAWSTPIRKTADMYTILPDDMRGGEYIVEIIKITHAVWQSQGNRYRFEVEDFISDIESYDEGEVYYTPQTAHDVCEKIIPFHYQKLYKRAFLYLTAAALDPYFYNTLPAEINTSLFDYGYYVSDVSLEQGASDFDFTNRYYGNTVPLPNPPSDLEGLKPFEPIIIDPSSTYRQSLKFAGDKTKIVPALVLYSLNLNANSETVSDGIVAALDAISIAFPPTSLLKIGTAGKYLYYADRASSFASIGAMTLDMNQTTDPTTQKVIQVTQAMSGVLGVGANGTGALLRLKNAGAARNLLIRDIIDKSSLDLSTEANFNIFNQSLQELVDASNNIYGPRHFNAEQVGAAEGIIHRRRAELRSLGYNVDDDLFDNALLKLSDGKRSIEFQEDMMLAGANESVVDGFRELSVVQQTKFIDDFSTSPNFFDWEEGMVRAWEVMDEFPSLRSNTDNLETVRRYISENPDTPLTIIKGSLPDSEDLMRIWIRRTNGERIPVELNSPSLLGQGGGTVTFEIVDKLTGTIMGQIKRYPGSENRKLSYFYTDFVGGNGIVKNNQYRLSSPLVPTYEINPNGLPNPQGLNLMYGDIKLPAVVNQNVRGLGEISFDDAFRLFDDNFGVDGLYGYWIRDPQLYSEYGGLSLNLSRFIEGVENLNMSFSQAAFHTITGDWARGKGLNNVIINTTDPSPWSAGLELNSVLVTFTK